MSGVQRKKTQDQLENRKKDSTKIIYMSDEQ